MNEKPKPLASKSAMKEATVHVEDKRPRPLRAQAQRSSVARRCPTRR